MRIIRIVFALAFAGVASVAWAKPFQGKGVTSQDVSDVMREYGFPVEATTDDRGFPRIKSQLDKVNWSVWFFECSKETKRCNSIQFAAGFNMKKSVSEARLGEWNRTKRFGRAYLDKDGEPWVEMDMDLERGATTEALKNDFDRWKLLMREFTKFIDFTPE